MQFIPENRSDIEKYYRGTFVKFKAHAVEKSLNADTLFYIENVDGIKVTGRSENEDSFVIWLSNKFPFEVDYVLPHKSFFQLNKNAVLLERVPAQQYWRGISTENTQMTYLAGSGSLKKVSITFDNLKAFVTKQSFYSLQSAIDAETMVSCVLSPRMQYLRSAQCIYIDHIPVCRVNPKLKTLFMMCPIFQEEIAELLKNNEEHTKFKFVDQQKEKEVAL